MSLISSLFTSDKRMFKTDEHVFPAYVKYGKRELIAKKNTLSGNFVQKFSFLLSTALSYYDLAHTHII